MLGCHCNAAGTVESMINNGSKYPYCPKKKCSCILGFTGKHCQCGHGSYDKDGTCKGISKNTLKPATFKFARQKQLYFAIMWFDQD